MEQIINKINNLLITSGVSIVIIVIFLALFEMKLVLDHPALITVLRLTLGALVIVDIICLILKLSI